MQSVVFSWITWLSDSLDRRASCTARAARSDAPIRSAWRMLVPSRCGVSVAFGM